MFNYLKCWKIGDLELSQPANNTLSNNNKKKSNKIYGVAPYVAPEILKGAASSKESDIYSLGMIMWELTTGCKPFANVEDINIMYKTLDGKRPEITNDTPEFFANLMKRCWDSNPLKRPTIHEVYDSAVKWCQLTGELIYFGVPFNGPVDSVYLVEAIRQAEKKRLELIQSKKLGPKSTEKYHPKADFTSRESSSFISIPLTLNSSIISFNLNQGTFH
jgi:serine/threonine protein kinase